MAEGFIVSSLALPADEEGAKSIVPGVCALDDPASGNTLHATKQGWLAPAADVWSNVALANIRLGVGVVVSLVEAEVLRAARSARTPNGDGVERGCHLPFIMDVRASDREPDRDPPSVSQNVPLAPHLRTVGWVGASEVPPFGAFTEALSREHQSHAIPCDRSYSPKSSLQRCRKTPARTHSLYLRWQVAPEPNAGGKAFHGHPVLSLYTTPARIFRAAIRGLPPFGRGGSSGSNGFTRSHNSSGMSSRGNACSIFRLDHNRIRPSRGFEIRSKAWDETPEQNGRSV